MTSGVLIGTEGGKDTGRSCILHFTYDGISWTMEKTAGISKVSLTSSLCSFLIHFLRSQNL